MSVHYSASVHLIGNAKDADVLHRLILVAELDRPSTQFDHRTTALPHGLVAASYNASQSKYRPSIWTRFGARDPLVDGLDVCFLLQWSAEGDSGVLCCRQGTLLPNRSADGASAMQAFEKHCCGLGLASPWDVFEPELRATPSLAGMRSEG